MRLGVGLKLRLVPVIDELNQDILVQVRELGLIGHAAHIIWLSAGCPSLGGGQVDAARCMHWFWQVISPREVGLLTLRAKTMHGLGNCIELEDPLVWMRG